MAQQHVFPGRRNGGKAERVAGPRPSFPPGPELRAAGVAPFAVRGVIEGFYGTPWADAQRLEMVSFIAARGMNTFVYGPKDDPLIRRDWRLEYDRHDLHRLRDLAATCAASGVRLAYAISPGLSIRYSSEEDTVALAAKLEAVARLGVRAFALLLDDIPRGLRHAADRAAFPDLVTAQSVLVDRIRRSLPPASHLTVCPTQYWGRGDEEDLGRLASAIDPTVDLFWTGRAVCSPTLELEDAERFERTAGRPPLYWDNYPVNDLAMCHELHIGPYRGRDASLHRASRGIVANPMALFEASKIPLATIADYLANPEGYDPDASWRAAIGDIAGPLDAEAFALFAENVEGSCLNSAEAPTVTAALRQFALRLEQGSPVEAGEELGTLAARLLAAAGRLLRGPVTNQALVDECRPWIESFELGSVAMARLASLACDDRLAEGASELGPLQARLRAQGVRVFGDVLDDALAGITGVRTGPGDGPATVARPVRAGLPPPPGASAAPSLAEP